ncbi:MAG TPA: DUF1707 domain-containing protein [Streptosporangiaceae bacterium]|nr:DUF1707 domain-containing protein [Streptosporangiaceae bacterium]
MRVSDADREQVAERLREHFAAGRLTSEELDERLATALNAKTVGDLRAVMSDLPEPTPPGPQPGQEPADWTSRPVYGYRRGPRLMPLALILIFAAIVLPSAGFVLVAFLKLILLFWLVVCVAGLFTAARFRRHTRRNWQSGGRRYHDHWRQY